MINLIKRLGIGLVDVVNNALDPYEDFTRVFLPPETQVPLAQKSQTFLVNLQSKFRQENGLYLYNISPDRNDVDFGDQAVNHGLASAALAFAYKNECVSPASVVDATKAISLLFENEKMVRGRDPRDPTKFADDCSNDTATGVLAGVYFPARYGPPNAGVEGIGNIRRLANELIANDYALVNQDGSKTRYGSLINGPLTDPQRSSLALAIFRAAGVMSGEPIYHQHFAKLYKKYGSLLPFAEFKFLDYTKSHEVHRCAIHLHILADLAQDNLELFLRCVKGLERIWTLNRKTRDPWLAALINRFWRIPDSDRNDVVHRLHEYPTNGKPPFRETLNSGPALSKYWADRGIRFIKVKGTVRASQPLPYHWLPSQDFWPQRHPFMCDGFEGMKEDVVRHSEVDFLAPYHLLRLQGVIGADQ